MIVTRYLLAEVIKTSIAVILILSFVGMSNEFVVQLAKAASGELPATVVLKLVYYNLPSLLGTLLPLGYFLGVVLAYGRLYADSEMTVLHACGVSLGHLIRVVFYPSLVLMALAAYIHIWLIPLSMAKQEELIARAQAELITYAISPGRFTRTEDNKSILFAEKVSEDHRHVQDVFIAQLPNMQSNQKKDVWGITAGKDGYRWHDPISGDDYLVLDNGHRYEGKPGGLDFKIIKFGRYGVRLETKQSDVDYNIHTTTTRELLNDKSREAFTELSWRLSIPLALIVVAFLAVPLSKVSPRKGKYANLLPSAIIIIAYCNLLILSRTWLQEGLTPSWLGLWWIHVVGALVAAALIAWRLNWVRKTKERMHADS